MKDLVPRLWNADDFGASDIALTITQQIVIISAFRLMIHSDSLENHRDFMMEIDWVNPTVKIQMSDKTTLRPFI